MCSTCPFSSTGIALHSECAHTILIQMSAVIRTQPSQSSITLILKLQEKSGVAGISLVLEIWSDDQHNTCVPSCHQSTQAVSPYITRFKQMLSVVFDWLNSVGHQCSGCRLIWALASPHYDDYFSCLRSIFCRQSCAKWRSLWCSVFWFKSAIEMWANQNLRFETAVASKLIFCRHKRTAATRKTR